MKSLNIIERSIFFILLINLVTQFTLWAVGGGDSGFKMMSSETSPTDYYTGVKVVYNTERNDYYYHDFLLEAYDFGELMIFGIAPIFVFLIYCLSFKMKPKTKD
jgi:hypothetical protein